MSVTTKPPLHLWIVGVVGLMWNAFGAFDYFMTKTKGDEWLRQNKMTEAQIAHFHSMPSWMTAVWAIGVWGALLGSLLLLFRSKWAVEVFLASLIAYVISLVYAYGINPMGDNSTMMMVMQAVIFLGCIFFVWYARRLRSAGVLR
jgi:hypothetical protein